MAFCTYKVLWTECVTENDVNENEVSQRIAEVHANASE